MWYSFTLIDINLLQWSSNLTSELPQFNKAQYSYEIDIEGTSENNSFTFNSTNNSVTLFSIKYFEELLELNNL